MNKTKIEWADYTWNPIKGLCPIGCWYCYARRMYKRFGMSPEIKSDHPDNDPQKMEKPCRIFVCSTFELFHPSADKYRDEIFNVIQAHVLCKSKATFVMLTKMPERIDRAMPDNVWLGVTITDEKEWPRITELAKHKVTIRFVCYEPLLGDVRPMNGCFSWIDWVILGDLTGHGKKYQSTREFLKDIVNPAREFGVPVFMKNSLREIWGGPLIQEFPK